MEGPVNVSPVKSRGTSVVAGAPSGDAVAPAGAPDAHETGKSFLTLSTIALALGLVALIYLILASARPRMVREVDASGRVTDEISVVHTLIYAVILAVIAGAVIWVLSKCR